MLSRDGVGKEIKCGDRGNAGFSPRFLVLHYFWNLLENDDNNLQLPCALCLSPWVPTFQFKISVLCFCSKKSKKQSGPRARSTALKMGIRYAPPSFLEGRKKTNRTQFCMHIKFALRQQGGAYLREFGGSRGNIYSVKMVMIKVGYGAHFENNWRRLSLQFCSSCSVFFVQYFYSHLHTIILQLHSI